MIRRPARRVLCAALLLSIAGCATPCCTKVYELKKPTHPDTHLNILFLGDGFKAGNPNSLQSYRAATHQLTEGLLKRWPFIHLQDRLGFYRMDVVDASGETGIKSCGSSCSAFIPLPVNSSFVEPSTPPVVSGTVATVRRDFELERCYEGPSVAKSGQCELMWPAGQGPMRARLLSHCAPDIDVIVIVANAQNEMGGGIWATSQSDQAMVTVGVPMDSSLTKISEAAINLMSHELGHALGLLDEYWSPEEVHSEEIPFNRNVWKPATQPWSGTVPWQALLTPGCGPAAMKPCCGFLNPPAQTGCITCGGPKPKATCSRVPWYCQLPMNYPTTAPVPPACQGDVCTPTCELDRLCPDVTHCNGYPGAWEGADNAEQGIYRSQWDCRMRSLADPAVFCPACALAMWPMFCHGTECGSIPPWIPLANFGP